MIPQEIKNSFYSKVAFAGPDECWEWTASTVGPAQYGQIAGKKFGRRSAHRFAYELWNGPIPEGQVVRHTCDHGPCVNPNHLILGTQADNVQDMWDRGRARLSSFFGSVYGEENLSSKLTEKQVYEIRYRCRKGDQSYAALAPVFGVAPETISCIARRKTWKHLPEVEYAF